jgi:hypothetical protein
MIGFDLQEMKGLLEKVTEKLTNISADAINLEFKDQYWDIPGQDAFDVTRPPKPEIRSLQDDIVELKRLLANSSSRTTTSEDVDRIISVLKAISHLYYTPTPLEAEKTQDLPE